MLLSILFVCLLTACAPDHESVSPQPDAVDQPRPVVTGAQQLITHHLDELAGRKTGLIANPTSRIGQTHLLDTLMARNVEITALFAPEHGFRGDVPAGEEIRDGVDTETGLPVFSLYGSTRKPTPEMLEGIDLLIFDMQDVGVRFYTYISTLGLVIEAASEAGIELWVLDRPNPLGGRYVSGWLLEDEFKSFVGAFPIPVVHGMTIGELARMMIAEQWVDTGGVDDSFLRVIPMQNWNRHMNWSHTGLDWRAPSPNLPHFSNALVYPGTCFLEGTTLSEGRGTRDPFMLVGSPTLQLPDSVLTRLSTDYPFLIEKTSFTPVSIHGMASNPKHENREVNGLRITPQTLDPEQLKPLEFGLELTREMLRHDPQAETLRFIYNLAGTRKIDQFFESSQSPDTFWQDDVQKFKQLRKLYLIYGGENVE